MLPSIKLYLLNPRGFCAGVVRAIETVKKALALWGAPIYVKHHIVHNKHVVEELQRKGAIFVEDLNKVPRRSRLIYSAHGVSPTVRVLARERDLVEIDATCGLVLRVHSAIKQFAAKGYHILILGHKDHVEVVGALGEAPHVTRVISSLSDIEELPFSRKEKLFYVVQTTLNLDDLSELTKRLIEKYPFIRTLPRSSVCYATTNRQQALKQIAQHVNLVLVVGDPTSSNSNRLREIAKKERVCSHLVNEAADLDPKWLKGVRAIGLTAGASTPEQIVQSCVAQLKVWSSLEIEEMKYVEENVYFQLPSEVKNPQQKPK